MTRICDIRHTATTQLPQDVANCNCCQDALSRLREQLRTVDGTGLYSETDEAPAYLATARDNLFSWMKHTRDSRNRAVTA